MGATLNLDLFQKSGLTGYVMLDQAGNANAPQGKRELVSTFGENRIASKWTRWFNTEARKRISFDVLAALNRSLTENYGSAKKGAIKEAMINVFGKSAWRQVESNKFTGGLSRVTAEDIHDVLKQLAGPKNVAKTTANPPYVAELKSVLTQKNNAGASVNVEKNGVNGLLADVAKESGAPVFDFVGKAAVEKCLNHWRSAGQKVIDGLKREDGKNPFDVPTQKILKHEIDKWINGRLESAEDDKTFKIDRALKDVAKDLAKFLVGLLKPKAIDLPQDMEETLRDCFVKEMNTSQTWDPIEKDFTVQLSKGKGEVVSCEVKSTITPAKHIKGTYNGNVVGRLKYENGVNGVICYSTKEAQHAVNNALTEFKVKGENGEWKTIFAGNRSGVVSASGLKDPRQRRAANKARAVESVKSNFLSRPDLIQKALTSTGNPVTLNFNMTSVSLLTPCDIGSCKELTQTRDQEQAWADVNAATDITITIKDADGKDKTVVLKPHVDMFTLCANPPKFQLGNGIGAGWKNVKESNKTAYNNFMRRIDEFLANNRDPKKAKYVILLRTQLRAIWDTESYKQDAGGAYKASVRVAMLSYLMGDVPCWNCKSGKDRTGMLDVECKNMALLIDQNCDIPPPTVEPTEVDNRRYRDMVLKSGNLEFQQYNTGLAGYKAIERSTTNRRRLGDCLKQAQGASKYVKV